MTTLAGLADRDRVENVLPSVSDARRRDFVLMAIRERCVTARETVPKQFSLGTGAVATLMDEQGTQRHDLESLS